VPDDQLEEAGFRNVSERRGITAEIPEYLEILEERHGISRSNQETTNRKKSVEIEDRVNMSK
jgi:hypothetical protein